ncbi:ATP-binding protein [Stenotrophomonas sp.]|uniref:sensor histidine kinase n=1 Tax=Stenotrophomonas sp. TaxID=69392 RepID=UPI0028A1477B|nr:ATP-binding protein [Stenotrophomonas sp.]
MQASSQVSRAGSRVRGAHRARTAPPLRVPTGTELQHLLLRTVPLLVGCLLGQWLPYLVDLPGRSLELFWLPGPLLLGWLLSTPVAQWREVLAAAAAGTLLGLLVPVVAYERVLATVGEFVLVTAFAWGLVRWQQSRPQLEGYRDLSLFLLTACVLLPLCAAWWHGFANGSAPDALQELRARAICQSVSYLLIAPAVINLGRSLRSPQRRQGWHLNAAALAVALLALLTLLWTVDWRDGVVTPLLSLAPVPILVWALIVFGVAGASVGVLLVAVLGTVLGQFGLGPFGFWSPERNLLTAQAWTLCTGLALLFLGALSDQKMSSRIKLHKAYQRLGEVTGRMLVVQEEERTRIARDLHDDINQSLAAISIRLSSLRHQLPDRERPIVTELQDQLLAVSNDIRSISHELHPSILRFTGLASALDAFCNKRNARCSLRLCCSIDCGPRLGEDSELSVFRIVQEALNNVDRHARASVADVRITVHGGDVVLRVDDDGVGMPSSASAGRAPGLGLISMEERARLLGGSLQVSQSPLGGTRIEVRFPVPGTRPQAAAVQ